MNHVIEMFEHLKVPLETIKLATNNFANENYIGRGGFGTVYKGELVLSGVYKIVALKRLDPKFGQGNPEFWKEIRILSLYKHENIVSLLGFCAESEEKIFIYEYASKRSLDSYLNNDDLKWIQRLKICIGAARGLKYLHDPGLTHQRILHRDIKSSNILLDEDWNARIADFGLSKFGPANQQYTFLVSNTVGTFGYCDPLYLETGLLTKESDVYSFGVVLFEVLCGRLSIGNGSDRCRPLTGLVRHYYEKGKINEIIHASIKDEITPSCLQEFTAIAYQCLSRDLKNRPAMIEVVSTLERALQYQITEGPPPYSSPVHQRFEPFQNLFTGQSRSFESDEEEHSSGKVQDGSALYDFIAGRDNELNLTAGEELEIEYEVDGWFYVKKKRPGRDGRMAGLVPVLYVTLS